jgi:hypothetical protein
MGSNGRRWTDQEADDFIALMASGRPFESVCASFGRDPAGARRHLIEIGAIRTVESHSGRPRNIAANPNGGMVDVAAHLGEPAPAGDVDTGCRWLFPGFNRRFCGKSNEPGYSWCAFHRDIVFTRSNGAP